MNKMNEVLNRKKEEPSPFDLKKRRTVPCLTKGKENRPLLIFFLLLFIWSFAQAQESKIPLELSQQNAQLVSQLPAKEFSLYESGSELINKKESLFPVSRVFQTEFTLQNTGASYKNNTILWCYIPLNNEYNQIVSKVSTTDEALLFKDSYGNFFLRFVIDDMLPYSTRIIRIDCNVLKSKRPVSFLQDETQLKKYLLEEALIEVDKPEIQALSRTLLQKTPYQTAEKIFDWIVDNITYSGFDKQDKGAYHALTHKEGDCTEQATLFAALCRANSIPVKGVSGYRCTGSCQGTERLHTWSEFYTDGAWHIADVTNRVFDKEEENYINLENYHSREPNPLGKAHRYSMDFTYKDVKTRIDITSVVRLR